jgi:preprotein translocase subunit SecE
MGSNRFIHLMYIMAAVVMAFLFAKTGEWLLGYAMAKPPETLISVGAVVLATGVAFALYRNDRVYELAAEVTNELRKVSWPSRAETRASTIIVIVTVLVFSVILGLYDYFWNWLTTRIYT